MPKEIKTLTADSSFADVIAFQAGRFSSLTKEQVETTKQNFKELDADKSGFLGPHEVTKIYERLGQPKTIIQVRQAISELDTDKDGQVSFVEFLTALSGAKKGGLDGVASDELETKEAIKREYEIKKKVAELRAAELEKEKQEAEEKERQKQEARANMSARAAIFEKGA